MTSLCRDPLAWIVRGLTVLTSVSLGLTGQINPFAAFLVPLAVGLGARRHERGERPGRLFEILFHVVGILALFYFFGMVLGRWRILAGSVVLIFVGQAYYAMRPPGRLEMRRLQLLAFFQMLALASTTTNVLFLVPFLLYVLLASMAYTLWALEDPEGERRRPAPLRGGMARASLGACLLAVAGAGLLFPLVPRYEAGLMSELSRSEKQDLSGFSDRVSFGDISGIKDSGAIAFRARVEGIDPDALRWRGIALDRFDGRSWSLSLSERTDALPAGEIEGERAWRVDFSGAPEGDLHARVRLEPLSTNVLFHLPGTTRIAATSLAGVEIDGWGNLYDPMRRRSQLIYHLKARGPGGLDETLGPRERERTLALPALDPRIPELAAEIGGEGDDPARKARRIEAWLATRLDYTTDVDDRGLEDPLATFLFERRTGHCEYFASAMAVMLRTLEIPSRVVNGFQPGQYSNLTGWWTVRMRNAHSWVEAWIPGEGWVTFDPTPAVSVGFAGGLLTTIRDMADLAVQYWDDRVIGFNAYNQINAVLTLRDALTAFFSRLGTSAFAGILLGVVVLLCGIAVVAVRRSGGGRDRQRPRTDWMDETLRRLEAKGWKRRPGQTLAQWAVEVRDGAGPPAAPLAELVALYYAVRFGGEEAPGERPGVLVESLQAVPRKEPA